MARNKGQALRRPQRPPPVQQPRRAVGGEPGLSPAVAPIGAVPREKPALETSPLQSAHPDVFTTMELDFFQRAEDLYARSFETWEDFEPKGQS